MDDLRKQLKDQLDLFDSLVEDIEETIRQLEEQS